MQYHHAALFQLRKCEVNSSRQAVARSGSRTNCRRQSSPPLDLWKNNGDTDVLLWLEEGFPHTTQPCLTTQPAKCLALAKPAPFARHLRVAERINFPLFTLVRRIAKVLFLARSLSLSFYLVIQLSDRLNLTVFCWLPATLWYTPPPRICKHQYIPSQTSVALHACLCVCVCEPVCVQNVFIKRQFSHFVWIFFTFRWENWISFLLFKLMRFVEGKVSYFNCLLPRLHGCH